MVFLQPSYRTAFRALLMKERAFHRSAFPFRILAGIRIKLLILLGQSLSPFMAATAT